MTDSDKLHRAERARALLQDDLLGEMFTEVKMDALVALSTVDPASFKEICRLQAIVHVLDEVLSKLHAVPTQAGERSGGVTMTATPKRNTA